MELDCIRHGATRSNVEGRFNGHSADGITADQAAVLRDLSLSIAGYDRIYSSPLRRCVETAQCLRIDSFIQDSRLSERHLGIFERLTLIECQDRHPQEFAVFRRLDEEFVIPGGESRAQHLTRTLDWLEEVSHLGRVLAVTHGGTIDFLYRLGSGLPPHGGDRVYAGGNAALSRLRVDWPEVQLVVYSVPLGDTFEEISEVRK